jgi:hypothetical protein
MTDTGIIVVTLLTGAIGLVVVIAAYFSEPGRERDREGGSQQR